MNDTTYIEASRVLAERVLQQSSEPEQRIQTIVLRVLGRGPADDELAALERQLQTTLGYYRDHPDDAEALIRQGQAPVETSVPAAELAAYTVLANTVLNLDEAVTHE